MEIGGLFERVRDLEDAPVVLVAADNLEAYRQAIDLYFTVPGFADVPRTMRAAQRGLEQVQQRIDDLSRVAPWA